MALSNVTPQIAAFRELHESGCFVIPNPWDAGSAKALHQLGFKALATTSAGYAFTRGLPDSASSLNCGDVLQHVREIVSATPLPVNADFQAGYSDAPDGVAHNVASCIRTGVAGLSIEDATGDNRSPLYERSIALERVRAARAAIDASGSGVLLTARCEAWLVGHPEAQRVVMDRLVAFADAGADCLYAPGVHDLKYIADIVKAVAPRPLNVLVSHHDPNLTVAHLADLGVRRISVGSALARVAWGAFLSAAEDIARSGRFDAFAEAAPFARLNKLFRQ